MWLMAIVKIQATAAEIRPKYGVNISIFISIKANIQKVRLKMNWV
jgi:hypothetical protein